MLPRAVVPSLGFASSELAHPYPFVIGVLESVRLLTEGRLLTKSLPRYFHTSCVNGPPVWPSTHHFYHMRFGRSRSVVSVAI